MSEPKPEPAECEYCGTESTLVSMDRRGVPLPFCSEDCANAYNAERRAEYNDPDTDDYEDPRSMGWVGNDGLP